MIFSKLKLYAIGFLIVALSVTAVYAKVQRDEKNRLASELEFANMQIVLLEQKALAESLIRDTEEERLRDIEDDKDKGLDAPTAIVLINGIERLHQ